MPPLTCLYLNEKDIRFTLKKVLKYFSFFHDLCSKKLSKRNPKLKIIKCLMKKKFLHPFQEGLHGNSAYDPFNLFNFDADPNPGFALGKNGSGSRSFL